MNEPRPIRWRIRSGLSREVDFDVRGDTSMTLVMDIATELYPVNVGDNFTVAFAKKLNDAGDPAV